MKLKTMLVVLSCSLASAGFAGQVYTHLGTGNKDRLSESNDAGALSCYITVTNNSSNYVEVYGLFEEDNPGLLNNLPYYHEIFKISPFDEKYMSFGNCNSFMRDIMVMTPHSSYDISVGSTVVVNYLNNQLQVKSSSK